MNRKEVIIMKKIMLVIVVIAVGVLVFINRGSINIFANKENETSNKSKLIEVEEEIKDGVIVNNKLYLETKDKVCSYNMNGNRLWSIEKEENTGVIYTDENIFISNGKDEIRKVNEDGELVVFYKGEFKEIYSARKYLVLLKEKSQEELLEVYDDSGKFISEITGISGNLISVDIDNEKKIILNIIDSNDGGLNSKLIYHSFYGDRLLERKIDDIIVQDIYLFDERNILIGSKEVLLMEEDIVKDRLIFKGEILNSSVDKKNKIVYLINSENKEYISKIELELEEFVESKIEGEGEIKKIISHEDKLYIIIENYIITKEN